MEHGTWHSHLKLKLIQHPLCAYYTLLKFKIVHRAYLSKAKCESLLWIMCKGWGFPYPHVLDMFLAWKFTVGMYPNLISYPKFWLRTQPYSNSFWYLWRCAQYYKNGGILPPPNHTEWQRDIMSCVSLEMICYLIFKPWIRYPFI